jgi:hydrogenase 3 maturation protease
MTMMSPSSWQTSLQQLLSQQEAKPRIALVGIGNVFRSDDAAGILIADRLIESRSISNLNTVLVIDAGHAPENSTADLRRFAPNVVLLIDAADMEEAPGTIRWIEMDEIEGMSASTHTLPLSMLAKYLILELNCKIALLGIQPKSNDVGEVISKEVADAVDIVIEGLVASIS